MSEEPEVFSATHKRTQHGNVAEVRLTSLEYASRLHNPSSDANYLLDNAKKIEAYLKGY